MANKLFGLGIIWVSVIFAYLFLGFLMPVWNTIAENTTTALDASANMSEFFGTKELIQASPVWVWFIPGSVAVVSTVIFFKSSKGRE